MIAVELSHVTQTLDFSTTYDNPVVIAHGPRFRGADAAAVRLHEVTGDSVTLSLQETNAPDGFHAAEAVTLVVLEAGNHLLADGTMIEAGTLESAKLSPQGFEQVTFATDFAERPAVLSQIQTFNGADFVVTRRDAADAGEVSLKMQEDEAGNGGSTPPRRWAGWRSLRAPASGRACAGSWRDGVGLPRRLRPPRLRRALRHGPERGGRDFQFRRRRPCHSALRRDRCVRLRRGGPGGSERRSGGRARPGDARYIAFAGVGALTGFELDAA